MYLMSQAQESTGVIRRLLFPQRDLEGLHVVKATAPPGRQEGQAGLRDVRIVSLSVDPFSCHYAKSPLFHPEAVILNFANS